MRLILALPLAALASSLLASTASAATITCQTVVACVLGVNQSSGYAIEGYSRAGTALVGTTVANATAATGARSGVAGYDRSTDKNAYNAGVSGTSPYGTGVRGTSTSGSGVAGFAGNPTTAYGFGSSGVYGRDTTDIPTQTKNFGVLGLSTYGTGMQAGSLYGHGLIAFGDIGVFGQGALLGRGIGVQGDSLHNSGVLATTVDGVALVAQATAGSALELRAPTSGVFGPTYLLFGDDGSTNVSEAVATVTIDSDGNEYLAGTLTTSGATTTRTHSTSGNDVVSYGARTASATLEDDGRGTLADGVAHVALDKTFASTIDTHSYLVFVTPHGDSRGLYTTVPTAAGFDVRENAAGRSTLVFDYRIVARPLDSPVAHLPSVSTLARVASAARVRHAAAIATPRRIVGN